MVSGIAVNKFQLVKDLLQNGRFFRSRFGPI